MLSSTSDRLTTNRATVRSFVSLFSLSFSLFTPVTISFRVLTLLGLRLILFFLSFLPTHQHGLTFFRSLLLCAPPLGWPQQTCNICGSFHELLYVTLKARPIHFNWILVNQVTDLLRLYCKSYPTRPPSHAHAYTGPLPRQSLPHHIIGRNERTTIPNA